MAGAQLGGSPAVLSAYVEWLQQDGGWGWDIQDRFTHTPITLMGSADSFDLSSTWLAWSSTYGSRISIDVRKVQYASAYQASASIMPANIPWVQPRIGVGGHDTGCDYQKARSPGPLK